MIRKFYSIEVLFNGEWVDGTGFTEKQEAESLVQDIKDRFKREGHLDGWEDDARIKEEEEHYCILAQQLCYNRTVPSNEKPIIFINRHKYAKWAEERDIILSQKLGIYGISKDEDIPENQKKLLVLTVICRRKWWQFWKNDEMKLICYLNEEDYKKDLKERNEKYFPHYVTWVNIGD